MWRNKNYIGFIFRSTIILFLLIFIVFNEYKLDKVQILYGGIIDAFIYIFIALIFILNSVFEIHKFIKCRCKFFLLPSIVGLILILLSFYIHFDHRKKMEEKTSFVARSKCIKYKNGEIKYRIEFKESKNYIIFEMEECGLSTNYYYGKYELDNSIIKLDKRIGKKKFSNFFMIKARNKNKTKNLSLIQIDKNGNVLDNQVRFILREISH